MLLLLGLFTQQLRHLNYFRIEIQRRTILDFLYRSYIGLHRPPIHQSMNVSPTTSEHYALKQTAVLQIPTHFNNFERLCYLVDMK